MNTTSIPQAATGTLTMFDIVTSALEAKNLFPCPRPMLGLPNDFDHHDVADLYLERHPGGWVANIAFADVPPGQPNTLGTPDASPFPSEREAFLAGAAFLCGILTGSAELPFIVTEDKLMVVGYGAGGFSGLFSMTRRLPWI